MAGKGEAKVKFTADTAQFSQEIKQADSTLKSLRSELRLNQAQMKTSGESVDGLAKSNQLLEQQNVALSQKITALSGKLAEAQRIWGENSDEAQRYANQIMSVRTSQERVRQQIAQTQTAMAELARSQSESESAYSKLSRTIAEQEAEMSRLERAYANAVLEYGKTSAEARQLEASISSLSSELSESKDEMSRAEQAASELARGIDKTSKAAEDGKNSIGELVAGNVLSNFANQGIAALTGLTEATEENRANMTRLDTAYQDSGRTVEEARQIYQEFYGILGDQDQAVEAAQDMRNLADAGADVDTWMTIAAGAASAMGDAIPTENLIESANETIRCGRLAA